MNTVRIETFSRIVYGEKNLGKKVLSKHLLPTVVLEGLMVVVETVLPVVVVTVLPVVVVTVLPVVVEAVDPVVVDCVVVVVWGIDAQFCTGLFGSPEGHLQPQSLPT